MRLTIRKDRARAHKRALRVRKHLRGDAIKPRLCVVKSNKHIHAQIIDDESGKTLGSIGTFSKEFRNSDVESKNKNSAAKLGTRIAEIAIAQNIHEVVFDRGPYKYHGILAALADAARSAGLRL